MSNESEADEAEADAAEEEVEEEGAADVDAETAAAEAGDDEAEPSDGDEAADETETDEEPEGFQEGDFVKLAYTARTVEGGDLVDTTDPEVVEEEGIEADQEFEPRTIVLGQGHIFESVEADILGGEVGDTGTVVVPAAEAFGEYDDEQVRTVTADKIPEDDRYPGAQVQIDGEQGRLETIIGGRARVDFNHPIAGEDIEYEWEVVDEVTDRQTKAEGLLSMMLDVDLDVWFQTDTVEEEQLVEEDEEREDEEADDESEDAADDDVDEVDDAEDEEPAEPETEVVEVEKESLYIDADPQLSMNQQWMMGKQQIAQQLMDLLDVDRVVVQEVIEGFGGMGMPGMMGMGGGGAGDVEAALEEADIDAEELAEGLEE